MVISSRTPEGTPHGCPVCGKTSAVEPSYPGGDSCCPNCGHLLWWFRHRLSRHARIAPEQITLSSSFSQDIGADSLDTVELIMELEEEFDVTIPDDEAERIKTVADAIRYIERHRGDRGPDRSSLDTFSADDRVAMPYIDQPAADQKSEWNATDRRDWIASGTVCAVIIAIADDSWVSAAVWLVATVGLACYGMPRVVRTASRLSDKRKSFYLDVALGWALFAGPLVGSIFGAISPVIWNLTISSFQGALIGLIAGSLFAAVQGIVLATIVLGVVWLVTGRRPDWGAEGCAQPMGRE